MKAILDNSNIVESYPGITSPLTTTFIERAYRGVFSGAVIRLSHDTKILKKLEDKLSHMVVDYHGRIYYDLLSWYSVLSIMPFEKRVKKIWREMLGVKNVDISKGEVRFGPFTKLRALCAVIRSGKTVPTEMENLSREFEKVYNDFYEKDLRRLSHSQLVDTYKHIESSLVRKWEVTLANDMYAFTYVWLAERCVPSARKYLSKLSNIESMTPVCELEKIARVAMRSGELEHIKNIHDDGGATIFLAQKSDLGQLIHAYISRFGDRYLEELKLESETYRTKPLLLLKRIVAFAEHITHLVTTAEAESSLPKTSFLGKIYIRRAAIGIKNRESSRLNRARLYGMVRTIVLQMARNLHAKNIIENPNDIFYMYLDELLSGNFPNTSTLDNRKNAYKDFEKESLPNRLIVDDDGRILETTATSNAIQELVGVPVSLSVIEAEILVVTDPHTCKNSTGKILVTKTTDPGWVFLLVDAAGIIAEKGSLLSHTAIIARELSKPAVVGVENATSILSSGQRVTLDGESGKITVVR